ncbi:hypothetical protein [Prauserella endophytica]|uniref:hypothetical protein n=1 Tax=Prauserella endophytica TaxID=1592324 RepID=UPI0019801AE2|nr:hypothetical protein [Prauserella endophytica]
MLDLVRGEVAAQFEGIEYHLNFRVSGKDGVMGELEPVTEIRSHELCVVIEGIAGTGELAESVTLMGTRQIFYARLPEVKGTAGTASFVVDDVLPAGSAYVWSMNHTVPVKDPMELFELTLCDVGAS